MQEAGVRGSILSGFRVFLCTLMKVWTAFEGPPPFVCFLGIFDRFGDILTLLRAICVILGFKWGGLEDGSGPFWILPFPLPE